MLTDSRPERRATFLARVRPLARTLAAATLLIVSAVGASHAQTQWVVDAGGSGDFTDLQAAITQAAPGDVLHILPGTYAAAELTKSLSLIGNPDLPKPFLTSLDIHAAPSFSLQHLHLRRLRVVGGESRSVIDFCQIGQTSQGAIWPVSSDFSSASHFVVQGAPDLVLSSSEVIGVRTNDLADGYLAMNVDQGALVHIVQSTVRALETKYSELYGPGYGADGLWVRNNSEVWLTASFIQGGSGQDGPQWFPSQTGEAGAGVYVASGGRLYARGRSDHQIVGGRVCGYSFWGVCSGGPESTSVVCEPGNAVLYSGVTLFNSANCIQQLSYNEPFLLGIGLGQVGTNKRVWFYGEAGVPAVLLAALAPAALPLAGLEGTPLWLDPGQLLLALPLVTTGFTTPVVQTFPLPASSALAGLQVYLQGVQPVQQDVWRATNLVNISLNW